MLLLERYSNTCDTTFKRTFLPDVVLTIIKPDGICTASVTSLFTAISSASLASTVSDLQKLFRWNGDK